MFGRKLQKFLADGGWHDQPAVLDALPPSQQVVGSEGVEHIAPLLFLLGGVAILTAPCKGVEFLVIIVGDLLLALAGEELLAGADAAQAAGFVGTALP